MADIVNLRRIRKAKARVDHAAEGAANRAQFGIARAARAEETLRRDILGRRLDGHRLETRDGRIDDGGRD